MSKANSFWDNTIWGTQADARDISIGAVRSYLRSMQIDPVTVNGDSALQSLEDLAKIDEKTISGHFMRYASINQLNLFVKDWNRWVRLEKSARQVSEQLKKIGY